MKTEMKFYEIELEDHVVARTIEAPTVAVIEIPEDWDI